MLRKRFWLALPLFDLLLSCQSSPVVSPLEKAQFKQPEVILETEFKGSDRLIPEKGCSLWVKNLLTNQELSIKIPKANSFVRTDLPPGKYQSTKFSCSLIRSWDLPNLFAQGLNLESDHLHFAGRFIFEFSDNDLESIKIASRQEINKSLELLFTQLGPYEADELVSGYTNRPIQKNMLQRESEGIQLKVSGSHSQWTKYLLKDLEVCHQNAKKTDPLLIGSLKLNARYDRSTNVNLETAQQKNAFSQSFVSCVESVLTTAKSLRSPTSVEMTF